MISVQKTGLEAADVHEVQGDAFGKGLKEDQGRKWSMEIAESSREQTP